MAVYTEVSDEELIDFLATYNLGDLLSCKGIAEGVENTNYLIHTSAGPHILTLYEKRVARGDLPYFLGLMEHLSSAGITCPLPVRDRDGEMLRELAGRPAAIITFLEGVWIRNPRPEHCSELGQALARMHLAGQSYSRTRANSLSAAAWQPLFDSFGTDADSIAQDLSSELENEIGDLENSWPHSLPAGVIHADLFPDNVFFLGKRISGFIDFYFACNDMLAYDVAICLNAWCFEKDNSFNITKARALLAAYNQIRPLTGEEYDALPVLARGAAMRFLLTRIFDWLNVAGDALVRPKDPLEYVRKLRFHKSVTSARDYGLGGD